MEYCGLQEMGHRGENFQSDTENGRQCMHAFVSGNSLRYLRTSLQVCARMQIWRTFLLTPHHVKYIKVQIVGKKTKNKAVGISKGGRNTKIHVIVDGLGNPISFLLSAGNEHDSKHAIPLLRQVDVKGSNILGDRAYNAKEIRDYIIAHQASYTIPPKKNNPNPWTLDCHTYKERHLIECFFQKLKWFRRVFKGV